MRDMLENIEAEAVRDPMKVAAQSMKKQRPKRFYKKVDVVEEEGSFLLHLDGRTVKTPTRQVVRVKTESTARVLAAEWQAQQEFIDPMSMPVTRLVNTAIDGVAKDMQVVKEDVIRFAGSDLLCYRAEGPKELIENQMRQWDPVLDWAQSALNARFVVAEGVIHVAQPVETIAAFGTHVGLVDDALQLAALHSITALTGSAIIAMAVYKEALEPEEGWRAAHVDEDWQISQWGEDDEARSLRNAKKEEFDAAVQVLKALR